MTTNDVDLEPCMWVIYQVCEMKIQSTNIMDGFYLDITNNILYSYIQGGKNRGEKIEKKRKIKII